MLSFIFIIKIWYGKIWHKLWLQKVIESSQRKLNGKAAGALTLVCTGME